MQTVIRTNSGLEVAVAMWHRRKWLALVVFLTLLATTVAVTRSLPNLYGSKATVIVEHQQVPERLMGPSVAGELETRLQTISQEVLSRSRLSELIDRFGLYPDSRGKATPEALIQRMRRDIRMDIEFTEGRESFGRGTAVAFTISYRGRDPQTVAQVTNAVAALYVERNARMREQQTAGTIDFLQARLDDVQQKLEAQQQQINEFKARHSGELPEQQPANLAALQRLNAQLSLNLDRQRSVIDRRDELVKRLAAPPGAVGAPDDLSAQLARLRQQLSDLRMRFTEEYPDVVRVKSEIAAIERQLADASARGGQPPLPADPVTSQLQGQLAKVDTELRLLGSEEETLRRAITDYGQRVENAPRREQELHQISGDYEALKAQYQSLRQRYDDAQLAGRAEAGQQGEQFRILDSAVPSLSPVAPNRLLLRLAGLMFAAVAAYGAAALAETRDTTFHTVDDLRTFTSVPVLASIAPTVTPRDARRRRWKFWLAAVAAAMSIVVVAGASLHFARENEALVRLLTPGRF